MHPVLFHLGHLVFPTFGLLAALGLAAAMFLLLRTAPLCALPPDSLWNAALFSILAAFLLSRLLLVATDLPSFRAAPILLLMQPSLTAGGLALTAVAAAIYLRGHRLPLLPALDSVAAPATLLWAALALGHLAEGSDPGLPTPHGLRTSLAGYREQPVALYAALVALALTLLLLLRTRRPHRPGRLAALALVLTGLAQFFLDFLRLPYLYPEPTPFADLDPIQWLALAMLVTGALLAFVGEVASGKAAAALAHPDAAHPDAVHPGAPDHAL